MWLRITSDTSGSPYQQFIIIIIIIIISSQKKSWEKIIRTTRCILWPLEGLSVMSGCRGLLSSHLAHPAAVSWGLCRFRSEARCHWEAVLSDKVLAAPTFLENLPHLTFLPAIPSSFLHPTSVNLGNLTLGYFHSICLWYIHILLSFLLVGVETEGNLSRYYPLPFEYA